MASIVAVDATFLLLFLSPHTGIPTDPATGMQIEHAKARAEFLVQTLETQKSRIIVPTPALSECLVHAGPALNSYLKILQSKVVFRIGSFDSKAAVEVALMAKSALASGDKKGGSGSSWAKIKYDRQIVAIARGEGASVIFSDDTDIKNIGELNNLTVTSLAACPLPPDLVNPQFEFSKGRQMPKKQLESDANQRTRFIEAARELGANEDEATFKAKLGVIARQKVEDKVQPSKTKAQKPPS